MTDVKPAFLSTPWFEDDPRFHIDKRAYIVVVFGYGSQFKQAIVAEVETKYGWSICFNHHGREIDHLPGIEENEDWPSGWIWTYVPRRP